MAGDAHHHLSFITHNLLKYKQMKKIREITLFIALALLIFGCNQEKSKMLEINGKVVNSDTKTICLIKIDQDYRRNFDSIIKIPVRDGKFYYKAKLKYPQAVELVLEESARRGAYRPMELFLENEKIDLTIYNEKEFDKNIVKGGKLNAEYAKLRNVFKDKFENRRMSLYNSVDSLDEIGEYNNEEATKLYEELQNTKDMQKKLELFKKRDEMIAAGTGLTPKAKELNDKIDAIDAEQFKFVNNYMVKHKSLVGYYFLIKELKSYKELKDKIDISWAKKTQELLAKANPNHPYNDLSRSLIDAIENIKVGNKFVDFTAPDLNGQKYTLSNEIKGKIALLDLWATWCGPCIAHSKSMLPVYEDYKDKGFTIVGVAGEFKNTKNLEKFLKKNKFPWLQLVDLDRKCKIWSKYGIGNAAGGTFLIDKNGKILVINPSAEEVRKELKKRLD